MRATQLVPSALVLALALAPAAAAADGAGTDYWVRVMPSLWFDQLRGDFSYERAGSAASTLSAGDLGLGDRERSLQIEAGAQLPFLFGFHAGYSDFSTDGAATLSRAVTFGNQTYAASTPLESSASLRDLWGEVCIRPLNLDVFGFSIGLAGHALTTELELKNATSGVKDSLDETIYIPAGALRAHVTPFLGMTVEGRLHYMELGYGGNHLQFAQAAIQASYRPIEWVGLIVGYRYDLYDVHVKDPNGANSAGDADITLDGPYAGIIAKF